MALVEYVNLCLSGRYGIAELDITSGDDYITIDDDSIVSGSLVIDSYSSSGDTLEIGSVIADELNFSIRNNNGEYDDFNFIGAYCVVNMYIGQDKYHYDLGTYLGDFIITDAVNKGNEIRIKALDLMIRLEKEVNWELLMEQYQLAKEDLVQSGEIDEFGNVTAMARAMMLDCDAGVGRIYAQCNKMFDDYSAVEGMSMTYRELLQYIGFITGTCKSRDFDGYIMGWYDRNILEEEEGPSTDYFESNSTNRYSHEISDKDISVTGISYKLDDGTVYTYGTSGYVIEASGCKLINSDNVQTVVDALGATIVGFTFRPYELTMKRLPFIAPLSTFDLVDERSGNTYRTIVTHQTYKINGTTSVAAKCTGSVNNQYQNISQLTSATQQAISESEAKTKEALRHTVKDAMEWKVLTANPGGGTKTYTFDVDELNEYSEFMIACQLAHKTNSRMLASTVIPKSTFMDYIGDHGNGAHQAYYNSTYSTGVSYLGNGSVKIYETSQAYAVFYAR